MPALTLRKRKPKNAPNINPASDTVTPVSVKPRPKPKPKKKAPAVPSDGEATGVAQVAPRDDENVKFKLRIAAETLASLKHTVPNAEATDSDLEIDDIGIGFGEIPWNSISADDRSRDSEEEEEEGDSVEEVDELIDDLSDGGLEEQGEIIFHLCNLFRFISNFYHDTDSIMLPTGSPVRRKGAPKLPVVKSPNASEIFKIPIDVPYRNATRDVVGITSITSYERAMRLIAERMDAGPSRMAAIGYIPSYKPKNPKPVAKLLEDDDAWDRLIGDVKAYIDSFASKRGTARQVKPFVITIIDTLEPDDPKESKVSILQPQIPSPVPTAM